MSQALESGSSEIYGFLGKQLSLAQIKPNFAGCVSLKNTKGFSDLVYVRPNDIFIKR